MLTGTHLNIIIIQTLTKISINTTSSNAKPPAGVACQERPREGCVHTSSCRISINLLLHVFHVLNILCMSTVRHTHAANDMHCLGPCDTSWAAFSSLASRPGAKVFLKNEFTAALARGLGLLVTSVLLSTWVVGWSILSDPARTAYALSISPGKTG